MKRLLTVLWLIVLVAIPLRAEKYALLVGINDYQNDIGALKYCVADVQAFRQALVNVAGFKKDRIFLMTDEMEGQMEPTNINVIMRLGILAKQIQPQDTFIFYFSGHGIVNDGSSFLLAANSNTVTQDTLEMSAVPLDRVSKILSSVKAQQLLTVIDACRNSPETGRSGEDNILTDDFSKGFKIRRSSSNGGQPSVSATLYACNVGERAYEWADKGHGVFSYYLLQGLNGEAVNSQGEVTVTGLAEYTQSNVVKWAEEYRGKKQTPWLSLQGGAKLVLAEGIEEKKSKLTLEADNVADPEAVMWKMIEGTTEVSDVEDFLQAFPQGKFVAVARLKLKQLERKTKPSRPTAKPEITKPTAPTPSEAQVIVRDGMVLIPAGSFSMGSRDGDHSNEKPLLHKVKLDVFYMDATEVTVGQFREFVNQSGYSYKGNWDSVAKYSPGDGYPMVYVTWNDATAYAKWAGKRLPTEAEWEYAARGGLAGKHYPWGDERATAEKANYLGGNTGKTMVVGSYPANGYGLYDMAGNVWEWCADWYGHDYYRRSPAKNPTGPSSGSYRVLRGGSWSDYPNLLRAANRSYNYPDNRNDLNGFRCVSGSN